jgi:hypothetical protein
MSMTRRHGDKETRRSFLVFTASLFLYLSASPSTATDKMDDLDPVVILDDRDIPVVLSYDFSVQLNSYSL